METRFIFTACKFGFENQCKKEVLAQLDNLRFAYSRPGFLTFKVAHGNVDFSLVNSLTFVRLAGSQPTALDQTRLLEHLQEYAGQEKTSSFQHLHVWNRILGDTHDQALLDYCKSGPESITPTIQEWAATRSIALNQRARMNDKVLNLIEVDEGKWWAAQHRVETPNQCWPGGVTRFSVPAEVVSRAYYKAKEAMAWSRFPLKSGDTCVEIGSAPGGAAQALLEKGLVVKGIDPAEMDEKVLANTNFVHIKKRGADVRKKDLTDAKWLFADSNVAPSHTLDTVEGIATNQHVQLHGMILTLKLLQGKLGDEIDDYRQRIRAMGFKYVKTKQLAFNRNEVCLIALRRKSILRFGRIREKQES